MSESTSHPSFLAPERLLQECDVTRTRRSGPGGQNRNKVETAVVLKHLPTGILAEANERRTQGENLSAALFRLRVKLALEVRSDVTQASPISPRWKARCRAGKISINPEHSDFPALLAEVLDMLTQKQMDVKAVAEHLECTSSQLIKFLSLEPRALLAVNSARLRAGLHRLK
jgi:hypothetical protein